MTKVLIVIGILVLIGVGGFIWSMGGIQRAGIFPGRIYQTKSLFPVSQPNANKHDLKVLSWNIAYAHGTYSEGVAGYEPKSKETMDATLQKIAEVIIQSGADVVLLQEVDFNAARSHYVNQLKVLSEKTGLSFAAESTSWKSNYVPFPYWPIRRQFGKVVSGGGVLSRYPIVYNQTRLYSKPAENSWWYNAFYPFRYTQKAEISLNGDIVTVLNSHLEAFKNGARMEQARQVVAQTAVGIQGGKMILVGGDFNTVPTEATVKNDFHDYTTDDYRGDETMAILHQIPGFDDVVPRELYAKNETLYFSFPAVKPNRRLDYLFVPRSVLVRAARVLPVGELSDHLPLQAELALPDSFFKHNTSR